MASNGPRGWCVRCWPTPTRPRRPRRRWTSAPSSAETMEFMRSRSEFAGIVFETGSAKEPLVTLGSRIMLGQVVSNLVINAAEAQPGGGEVRTSSRREGGRVVVDVADRGPGVAEADRQRVFEPFFSTKDSTGLGLSVCHSIVREHGGELVVLPRPGGRSRLPHEPARARRGRGLTAAQDVAGRGSSWWRTSPTSATPCSSCCARGASRWWAPPGWPTRSGSSSARRSTWSSPTSRWPGSPGSTS